MSFSRFERANKQSYMFKIENELEGSSLDPEFIFVYTLSSVVSHRPRK